MKFSQIVTEAQLSDITIGFEVECILPDYPRVRKPLEDILNKYNIEWDNDSSINPSGKYLKEETYEFKIGELVDADGGVSQMRATPENFIKCANFVHDLFKLGGYTNESCGLHAHFGIGELTRLSNLQNVWLTMYMIKTGLLRDKYLEFKGYPLFDMEYASLDYVKSSVDDLITELRSIGDKQERINFLYHSLISRRNFEKYSTLFPHSQGTVEWRGLRGILDGFIKEDYNTILDFFKLAASFAKDISKAINSFDKVEVAGVTLPEIMRYAHQQGVPADKQVKKEIIDLVRSMGFVPDLEQKVMDGFLETRFFKNRMYNDQDIKDLYIDRFKSLLNKSALYIGYFYKIFEERIDVRIIANTHYTEAVISFAAINQTFEIDNTWADAKNSKIKLIGFFSNCKLIIKDMSILKDLQSLLAGSTIESQSIIYVPDLETYSQSDFATDFADVKVQEYTE